MSTTPKRHDALCVATGLHDSRCPDTEVAVTPRADGGKFAKGHGGNVHGLRSRRKLRDAFLERTDGGQDIIKHALFLAGVACDPLQVQSPSYQVQARVIVKILDIIAGRQTRRVELSGTVKHEVAQRMPDGWAARLTDEELERLRAIEAKLQLPAPEKIEDAEIVED